MHRRRYVTGVGGSLGATLTALARSTPVTAATPTLRILEMTDPVDAGETLEVIAAINQRGEGDRARASAEVTLVVDGKRVATEVAPTLPGGTAIVVLQHEIDPDEESGERRVRVETRDESDERTVAVCGRDDAPLKRVSPAREITVQPGSSVFFEASVPPEVDPLHVGWTLADDGGETRSYGGVFPFMQQHGLTDHATFLNTFEETGTYRVSVTYPPGCGDTDHPANCGAVDDAVDGASNTNADANSSDDANSSTNADANSSDGDKTDDSGRDDADGSDGDTEDGCSGSVTWIVHVDEDGLAPPTFEEISTDPAGDETVTVDDAVTITISARDSGGALDRILWEEVIDGTVVDVTELQEERETVTYTIEDGSQWLAMDARLNAWLLSEAGLIHGPESIVGPEVRPPFDVDVVETNEPVAGGETLTVTARIENTRPGIHGGESTQEVVLIADGERVAAESMTLASGGADTITFQYETEPAAETVDLPISVESPDGRDDVVVGVLGSDATER